MRKLTQEEILRERKDNYEKMKHLYRSEYIWRLLWFLLIPALSALLIFSLEVIRTKLL